jgi:hypothetical protein
VALSITRKGAGRAAGGVTLLAMAIVLSVTTAGEAADRPVVDGTPVIGGTAIVGQTLTASGGHGYGPPGTQFSYIWARCSSTDEGSCRLLPNSETTTYRLTSSDQGGWMRVAYYGFDRDGHSAWRVSDPFGPVSSTAPAPAPTPVATPTPTPDPSFDVAAPVATPVPNSGPVLTPNQRKAKRLRPFPTIRIRGRLTSSGARVTALTIRAPHKVKIMVTCGGPGCPTHRWHGSAARTHLARFERNLRAGMWIRVKITKRGYIGKQTLIRIRLGKVPLRTDGCLYPGARKAKACPAG